MYKIKTYNKISKIGLEAFDDKYTVGDEVENADGAIVRSAALHDEEFPASLKAIARAGAGTNNIPIDRCSEQGIVVFNTPGANANAVKELVIAGLLISSRRVVSGIEWAKTLKGDGAEVGKEVEKGKGAFAGPEIKGKTLGVIGLGAIGVMVANAANALGMKVFGYDPYLSVKSAWNLTHNAVHIFDINEIFEKCDYITVHVPLTDSTKNLINAAAIAKMKDGVRILNFARGELVNSDDILASLADGKVAAYATDFPTDAQLGVPGVIAIPHLGASTPESEDNCAVMAADELISYIERGEVKNSVNLPELTLPAEFEKRVCVIYKDGEGVRENIVAALGGNITSLNSAAKNGLGYLVCDTPNPDSERITAVSGVVRMRII